MKQQSLNTQLKKINYVVRRAREKAWDAIDDTYRSLWYDRQTQPIINQKEIRVVGLRRSGNHAIINWISKQLDNPPVFINHTRVLENPYRDAYRDQLMKQRDPGIKGWRCDDINWWKQHSIGNLSPKECLIYSYEDQELERITHPDFEQKHDFYVGKSQERYDVIIIRDPFNLIASRIKGRDSKATQSYKRTFDFMKVYSRTRSLADLWVCYAKECLGETHFLKHKVVVNYNQWFTDVAYRQQLAAQLNLTFSDAGFGDVRVAGGGSSFDGLKFSGDASQMDVLNRWQAFADDPAYRQLFEHEELLTYSRKLFGVIPGTEAIAP